MQKISESPTQSQGTGVTADPGKALSSRTPHPRENLPAIPLPPPVAIDNRMRQVRCAGSPPNRLI